jgi:hypothetical protein
MNLAPLSIILPGVPLVVDATGVVSTSRGLWKLLESGSTSPKRTRTEAERGRRPKRAPREKVQTAVSIASGTSAVEPICSLPVVGATTVEDAVFYAAVGAVALAELVSWPAAALFATGHALHQRTRNVIRAGAMGEAREGLIEAFEDVS